MIDNQIAKREKSNFSMRKKSSNKKLNVSLGWNNKYVNENRDGQISK